MVKKKKSQNNHLKALQKHREKNPSHRVKILKDGFASANHFFISSSLPELSGVLIKAVTTFSGWEKLESFIRNYPDRFGREFYSHLVNPAILKIRRKSRPREKQKGIQPLANEIKIAAGKLYAFNRYWCKRPFKEWPNNLKQVIDIAKKERHEDWLKVNPYNYQIYQSKYAPKDLTAYIIDKVYGWSAKQKGLKPLFEGRDQDRESTDNFYITYIQGKRGLSKNCSQSIKSKSPEEVTQLIHTDPTLEYIFLSLYLG